ncbi:AAA domain-containing protein [Novosphingobium sp. CF614]|nr:AAA domain-containing protein [Novosphingobium sp. CF614]
MIRIEKITIKEFRGIRDLELVMSGQNFAACGPNGTGKSGIVDAIEFALTGSISRLSGEGTGDLSVKQHGPHVDFRNKPEQSMVTLDVSIPSLNGKKATIHRVVKTADGSEIHTHELETQVERAQCAEGAMLALEEMREVAAALYLNEFGSTWKPVSSSRFNHGAMLTSALVEGRDFLRARAEAKRRAATRLLRLPEVMAGVGMKRSASKYPPAEPGALRCEPLKAAGSGR